MARKVSDIGQPEKDGHTALEINAKSLRDPEAAKVLQKRDLTSRVAQRTGQRNAQVRDIVEATLAELGEAITRGQTLALPPLGRARISRQLDATGAEIIVLRLRRRAREASEPVPHEI